MIHIIVPNIKTPKGENLYIYILTLYDIRVYHNVGKNKFHLFI